jgi:recombination protein RecA
MDNAEGSSRSVIDLSPEQRSVLVGTLLGDGCLALHGRHPRLHIKHKEAHKALAEFKYGVFENFISMPLHSFDQKLGDKRFPCVQFASKTNASFMEFYQDFYEDRRKRVPQDIVGRLTPLAIAVWFMDDGAADYAGATFQTHNFSENEVRLLARALGERYELAVRLRLNKSRWILYVTASQMPILQKIVGPYMLEELKYKLVPRRTRTP